MRGAHRGVCCSKGQRLMEAELFAAPAFAPCTGWPRTVMRGGSRKLTSGPDSVPKPARRTEPSSRFSRFAAHLRCVSAKEGLGESRGGKGTIRCPCPLLPPRRGHGVPRPPKAATVHAHFERESRLQRRAAVSAEGLPSADGKFFLTFFLKERKPASSRRPRKPS